MESAFAEDPGFSPAGVSGPSNLGTFNVVIQPGSVLSENAAAMAAFNRAAATWGSYLSDPITINISADVYSFGPGNGNVIGSAWSNQLHASYGYVAAGLAGDASGEADSIVAYLPVSLGSSQVHLPEGITFSNMVNLTTANAKAIAGALGLTPAQIEQIAGTSTDAYIHFNSDFAFDYDRSDGISAGMIDFEGVALHEIGHALGFISQSDTADSGHTGPMDITTLDLFRLAASSTLETPGDFTNAIRELTPGAPAVFFDGTSIHGFSTGVTGGDGRQGSHWKDDDLTGFFIGTMDPTISYGQILNLTEVDLRAMDLIGYDVLYPAAVPEPSAWAGLLLLPLFALRRRRA